MPDPLALRSVPYDHPDAQSLTSTVQDFYVVIYGAPDTTPFTADEFADPHGDFLVGYLGEQPVAMGGWRFRAPTAARPHARTAEIKRMFVHETVRGRGFARDLLSALEAGAAAAGATWMVLETGRPQVAAVAFYRACGYGDIEPFGYYATEPGVVSLGKALAG